MGKRSRERREQFFAQRAHQPTLDQFAHFEEDPFAFPTPETLSIDFSRGVVPEMDPVEQAARAFEPKPDFDSDPAAWGEQRLGEFYWSAQREILESIRDNRYTAVQSCHDAGKSFIAARAIAKWIDTHEPGEAFVVSTAPTSAQVSAILWRELQKAHSKALPPPLPGQITISGYPQWKIAGGELVGYGRKPADYAESAFQGIHARYVLIVIDEAGGIPPTLYNAVDALATNVHARVLAIGNPDDPTSHFADICKRNSGWNVIRIDGLKTPNFTQEQVEWLDCPQCKQQGRNEPLLAQLYREERLDYTTEHVPDNIRDMLLSPLWAEERLHRWVGVPGEGQQLAALARTSALFTSKVRGEFPTDSTDGIIPLGWVEAAIQRWHDWNEKGQPPVEGRFVLGADIAGTGADSTVFGHRVGPVVQKCTEHRYGDTMETVGHIRAVLTEPHSSAVVDSIGIGTGVVDRLRELRADVVPFTGSASAKGMTDKSGEFGFTNVRSAAWWNMREMLDPSRGSIVALPDLENLRTDLTVPKWKVTSGGKIQVEPKDEVKKRLGRSPDHGDAVVMSFWIDASPRGGAAEEPDVVSWWSDSAPDPSVLSWGI